MERAAVTPLNGPSGFGAELNVGNPIGKSDLEDLKRLYVRDLVRNGFLLAPADSTVWLQNGQVFWRE